MAQAHKDRNGNWRVRYIDPDGHRRSATFKTAAEGNSFLANTHVDIVAGRYTAPEHGGRLFSDWAEEFFTITRPATREATRAADLSLYTNHIEPRWGSKKLKSIVRNDVRRWVADLSNPEVHQQLRWDKEKKAYVADGGPLSPRTVGHVYSIFGKIIRAAVDEDMIPDPLPKRPPIPEFKPKKERYLRTAEIAHLASCFPDKYEALVYLCCYGGPRIGETAALQLSDVDWAHSRIRIDQGQTEVNGFINYEAPKTAAGFRWIPLPDLVITVLRAHIEERVGWDDPHAYLFTSPKDSVFRVHDWRKRVFDKAVGESGLERLTPHDMRHTAASILISEGANRWELASILGHKDTRMVDRVYGHLFEEDREALRKRISKRAQAGATSVPITRIGTRRQAQ